MKLTILNRLKICFEVLTIRSGHRHSANIKQLSVFIAGYHAGIKDESLNNGESVCNNCLQYDHIPDVGK